MHEKNRKIYIIGPAGSGKTTLAGKLNKRYGLPILNLDDIFWKKKYTEEFSGKEKQKILSNFLDKYQRTGWIIEGANKDFLKQTSREATKVIWLNENIFILAYRLVKRFLHNKKTKPEDTWYGLYWLLKGVTSYKLKNSLYSKHRRVTAEKQEK